MFSIFKRNKKDDESTQEVIHITQSIEIINDLIVIFENDSFKSSVNINHVDQIILEHHGLYENGRPNCWLSLRAKGQEMMSVSTLANNYEKLDDKLVNLTGFNATNYHELINYEKSLNDVSIFRREVKEANEPVVGKDIAFVDDSAFERRPIDNNTESQAVDKFKELESKFGSFDFDFNMSDDVVETPIKKEVSIDEFIIVDDRETLITWKSYGSIDRKYFNRDVFEEDGKFGYKYKIEYITIFDSIKLPYLETRSVLAKSENAINEKYPVEDYFCEIHSNYMLDEFNKMTEQLNTFFGKKGETYSTESRLPVYTLKVNSVTIDIKTTPTSIKLHFIKEIDETDFYAKPYSKELSLNYIETLKIPSKLNILANYKNSGKVMFTPDCLKDLFKDENDTIFWIHKDGSKFGMANLKYGVTFKAVKLIKIRLAVEMHLGVEKNNRIEFIYKDGKKFTKLSVENSEEFAKYLPEVMRFLKLPFTLYKYDRI